MTTETVRDEIDAWREGRETAIPPGFRNPRFWSAISMLSERLEKRGILDARIIRGICPTCGGSKGVERAIVVDGEVQTFSKESCPDCADTPVFVIEPAAWRDCKTVLKGMVPRGSRTVKAREAQIETHAVALLQALLPGARVAEEVGSLSIEHVGDGTPIAMLIGEDGKTLGTARTGDTIAILATQAREEVEE
ncbi:hypothetical protein KAW64_05240 [bacterium]|nr:hypothetical protein [bacterium]